MEIRRGRRGGLSAWRESYMIGGRKSDMAEPDPSAPAGRITESEIPFVGEAEVTHEEETPAAEVREVHPRRPLPPVPERPAD